jgi:hypothetical protein
MIPIRTVCALAFCLTLAHCHVAVHAGTTEGVTVVRIPGGGVQPQAAVDAKGVVHLIYLKGDPGHSDVEYIRSTDGGDTWSTPLRVNSQPGSAIAIGTVRGAHLALGREGRVHIAWMGSSVAEPKAPGGAAPMLYARMADDGRSFDPQRNVIASHPGLDGGGSIAADDRGDVYVAWHAPSVPKAGEQDRRVWVARSSDDGRTFAPEVSLSDPATGACGCCGMRLFAAGGKVWALYRGAAEQVNRGMYLLEADADLSHPRDREIAPMKIGVCVMSTAAFGRAGTRPLAAWETNEQIFWSTISPTGGIEAHPIPGAAKRRKHPAITADSAGQILLAWTEGTGWNKGGSVAWQRFDASGKPILGSAGRADDLPVWDSPAVFSLPGGRFVLVY